MGAGPGRPGRVWFPASRPSSATGAHFGPSMYYELRVGYSRMSRASTIRHASTRRWPKIWEFRTPTAMARRPGLSTTNITGMTGLGDGSGSLQKINNNWEIDQAFSWVHDRHELKFGFDYMSRRFDFFSPGCAERRLHLQRDL